MESAIFFNPWVGEKYSQSENGKLLIVGHSHYNEGDINPQLTIEVVTEYLGARDGKQDYKYWMSTFINFERAYYGKRDITPDESHALWESVVFMNFLQRALSEDKKYSRGRSEDYERGRQAFCEVVKKYEPDIIIVWGLPAYRNAPGLGEDVNYDYSGTTIESYLYTSLLPKRIHMLRIHHPSRNFSYMAWHEIMWDYLENRCK